MFVSYETKIGISLPPAHLQAMESPVLRAKSCESVGSLSRLLPLQFQGESNQTIRLLGGSVDIDLDLRVGDRFACDGANRFGRDRQRRQNARAQRTEGVPDRLFTRPAHQRTNPKRRRRLGGASRCRSPAFPDDADDGLE